eukprot:13021213-Alexandrium_andersonii.AAC.2
MAASSQTTTTRWLRKQCPARALRLSQTACLRNALRLSPLVLNPACAIPYALRRALPLHWAALSPGPPATRTRAMFDAGALRRSAAVPRKRDQACGRPQPIAQCAGPG